MAATITGAMAQEKLNPWGLVYDGALTENVVGEVQLHPVSYEVGGLRVSANVYTPKGYTKDGSYAAIVVSHPNGGVKEQVSGLFAQKLADAGYVAIACDARYQGQSAGQPRGNDIPANRIEDIRGMIDFISQYPGVDKQRIGAFGICGGGGYTVAAAQSDHRIKAVAALSMFNTGRVRRNGYGDSQLSTVQQRLMEAAEARQHQAETGVVAYPPKQAIPTEEQLAAMPFDLYREGIFYYGTSKYRHENDGASAPVACMLDLMMWDATDRMELITQPLLLMAGEKADSKYMTDEAMEKATGTNRKELFVIPGATHIKTYYVEEYVEQERRKLVEFFGTYL
jgi:fermentation-respiration switch protein FrsA (DUF1100 family)